MVGVEIRTNLRMDAAGAFAFLAGIEVSSVHAIHISRWSAKVAEVAFEVGHLGDLFHLF